MARSQRSYSLKTGSIYCPNRCVVTEDVTSDTCNVGKGDVVDVVGPDGKSMSFVLCGGERTSVRNDFLCDLDRRDFLPNSYPARIIEALDIFAGIKIGDLDPLPLRRLTARLMKLSLDFTDCPLAEAASEVKMAIELLDKAPGDFQEYPMMPRHFRKHLGKAFLAWRARHQSVRPPTSDVVFAPCVAHRP